MIEEQTHINKNLRSKADYALASEKSRNASAYSKVIKLKLEIRTPTQTRYSFVKNLLTTISWNASVMQAMMSLNR